jgi:TetR/AcrR family transcriptional regulator, transcriptional repressor for nem operon
MARIVNKEEYNKKRNEILDTAQKLVYTIGYDQMTIQDILNETKMSKGAFYHYFTSKSDLLEALITHMLYGIMDTIQPIVDDPNLSGLEKLNKYFKQAASWKTARKPFFIAVIKSWYSDGNILVRIKSEQATIKIARPMIDKIIAQAIEEGDIHTDFPEYATQMIFNVFIGLGDIMVDSILSPEPNPDFKRVLLAHTTAIELILGVKPGSLIFMNPDLLDEWREPADTTGMK